MKQILASLLCVSALGACCSMNATPEAMAARETAGPAGPSTAKTTGPQGTAPKAATPQAATPKAATPKVAAPPTAGPAAPAGRAANKQSTPEQPPLKAAHAEALRWLVTQQAADGSWSGKGEADLNKVGLTGLALLALQTDGSTTRSGPSSQAVARGVQWLISQQDAESGLIGKQEGLAYTYRHAIATQSLCVALKNAPNDQLRKSA